MTFSYDPQNIFAKILRGEIPNKTVFENEHALAFEDIAAKAPVHVLVIPKGPYVSLDHFAAEASADEQVGFMQAVAEVCKMNGVENGFRAIANTAKMVFKRCRISICIFLAAGSWGACCPMHDFVGFAPQTRCLRREYCWKDERGRGFLRPYLLLDVRERKTSSRSASSVFTSAIRMPAA